MAYRAIVIQDLGDHDDPYIFAGSDANGNTVEDPLDHGLSHKFIANTIGVEMKKAGESTFKEILSDINVEIEMTITDCRVIYRCDKYDKGSRWRGGATALAMNAISKAAANKRSAGKLLLGHIRYEWISAITYIHKPKTGFLDLSITQACIYYTDKEKNTYLVQTIFNGDVDTTFIANDILHRTSKYRLAMGGESSERDISFFEKYSNENITVNPNKKEKSSILLPSYYPAPFGQKYRPNW